MVNFTMREMMYLVHSLLKGVPSDVVTLYRMKKNENELWMVI